MDEHVDQETSRTVQVIDPLEKRRDRNKKIPGALIASEPGTIKPVTTYIVGESISEPKTYLFTCRASSPIVEREGDTERFPLFFSSEGVTNDPLCTYWKVSFFLVKETFQRLEQMKGWPSPGPALL